MHVVKSIDAVKDLVGKEVGVSEWVLIDQNRINAFADATGDHQWIHVDVERAKRDMPGGKTIAHGYLTLSLLPMMMAQIMRFENVSRGINYGSDKVRFTNTVPVDSRVRARQKVIEAEPVRGNGMKVKNEVTIEIEGQERPACIAEVISIVYA
jgi:acyl dehydratase